MNKEGMKAGVKEFGVSAFIDVVVVSVESGRGMEERKGKKTVPFLALRAHSSASLLPPLTPHAPQGLHSGSDKKYDALIIDEDKVGF